MQTPEDIRFQVGHGLRFVQMQDKRLALSVDGVGALVDPLAYRGGPERFGHAPTRGCGDPHAVVGFFLDARRQRCPACQVLVVKGDE